MYLPAWVPSVSEFDPLAFPLRFVWIGFIADTLFWALVWWLLLRGRRFARTIHRRAVDDVAFASATVRRLVAHRNALRRCVLLIGLGLIGWRIAWPVLDGHFEIRRGWSDLAAVAAVQLVGRSSTGAKATVHDQRYSVVISNAEIGRPDRFLRRNRVTLHYGDAWRNSVDQHPAGEIVKVGPRPHHGRIRWADGTVSETVRIAHCELWNEDATSLQIGKQSTIEPGFVWHIPALLRTSGLALLYLILYSAAPLIVVIGLTQKPLWRIGPVTAACPRCGYSLQRLTAPGCPECGWGR